MHEKGIHNTRMFDKGTAYINDIYQKVLKHIAPFEYEPQGSLHWQWISSLVKALLIWSKFLHGQELL